VCTEEWTVIEDISVYRMDCHCRHYYVQNGLPLDISVHRMDCHYTH